MGQVEAGLTVLKANVEERRQWLALRPQEVRRLRDLAVGVKNLGDEEAKHGRTAQACGRYDEFRGLVARMKTSADFAAMDMANTMADLAKMDAKYCANPAQRKIP